MHITSLHNPHVKDAVKLRQRRQREKQGRMLIDGARELMRAMAAGVELVELFVCGPLCQSPAAQQALKRIDETGVARLTVTPQVFEKLAFGERAEGVMGVATTPRRSLADLQLPGCPLVAVVEGLEKPGNLGAILRTADAAGVSAVIAAGQGTDLFNPNVVRASLGTVFSMPVAVASAEDAVRFLREHALRIYTARVDADMHYTEAGLDLPAALVLGSETAGLSDAWRGEDVVAIKLPMLGVADSLNVSATAAVLFYEALRQRWKKQ
ncbi:MAG TPA: RNA methyltransferase [Pirellulales bacterium]|nr:RNA methyltransferase [Pirellulales bacterium]